MLQVHVQNFLPDSKCFRYMYKIVYNAPHNNPDVVYKVANDAILIQTRCVKSVVSLEKLLLGPLSRGRGQKRYLGLATDAKHRTISLR